MTSSGLIALTEIKESDLIDISPTLSEKTAVFPGDEPLSRKTLLDFKKGHHLLLSSVGGTLHLGAHADAPNHYHPQGVGIHDRALAPYFGPAQVITARTPRGKRIALADLATTEIRATRVLLKTGSYPDPENWNPDFCSLEPALIHALADRGVKLIGIDTPSIDPSDSKKLESHQAIYARDLCVLEGIVLDRAPDGIYWLSALPIKIQDADAGWVRAILVRISA